MDLPSLIFLISTHEENIGLKKGEVKNGQDFESTDMYCQEVANKAIILSRRYLEIVAAKNSKICGKLPSFQKQTFFPKLK